MIRRIIAGVFIGPAIAVVGVVVQAVDTAVPDGQGGTLVTGATATAAVGALVFVARLMASGKLVPQPIETLLRDNEKRELGYQDMVMESQDREDALRSLLLALGIEHGKKLIQREEG